MSEDIPEWLAVLACAMMWCMGYLTCGATIGQTPFWRGVRSAFSLGLHRPEPPHE